MRFSRLLAFLCLALFLFACASPAIQHVVPGGAPAPDSAQAGWMALMMGWIPPATIPWSANLMLAAGFALHPSRRYGEACCLGIAATLTGLTTFFLFHAAALRIGYYLWEASFLVFAASAYLAREAQYGKRVELDEGLS